ncbi:docking protein 1-like [Ascaphus truei]|uniref:docking protein 1-like n=1 Tax=Ascaphus truei TaxID=8439 RepID=UPI003F593E54
MSAADKPVKEGHLHVKQNKFGKKWKRCHVLLYPDSPFGVARLEFYDGKDTALSGEKLHTRRATDRKVVRLAECVCVSPTPTESGPKDNMAAFTLETNDKTILLATERSLTEEWIQRLCEVAFPVSSHAHRRRGQCDPGGSESLEMAVNSIYFTREEVCEFWVAVQRTEAADRCSLRGSYILRADADCLILKDPHTKDARLSWPYRLLRRYGRDKVMFSFEAGRRCSSGPGNFTFETSQGHEIFQRVESSIRAQQGPEKRLSFPALDTDSSTETLTQGPESGSPEDQTNTGPVRKELEEKPHKCRTLPNLPGAKPSPPQHLLDPPALGVTPVVTSTPPRSPVSRTASHTGGNIEHMVGVYSEPKDSVRGAKPHVDSLYSDPVDSLAGKGVIGQKSHTDVRGVSPLYSDLYEQVEYEMVGGGAPSKTHRFPAPPPEEHIYDEPEGISQLPQTSHPPQLYSEVRMEAGAWKRQANDEMLGYEYPYNPSTDDYSVPNFQGPRSQPRSRAAGPKPVPAPKPQGLVIPKSLGKEGDPEKMSGCAPSISSNSNNNNSNTEVVYSQVLKPGLGPTCAKEAGQTLTLNPQPAPVQLLPTKPLPVPALPLPAKPQPVPALPLPTNPQPAPALPLPAKPQRVPAKPQPVPALPLSAKPQPVPAKPQPSLPLPAKPQPVPALPLPAKPQRVPSLPLPAKPLPVPAKTLLVSAQNSSGLSSINSLPTQVLVFPEEELSVDSNRLTSIYEDMGML